MINATISIQRATRTSDGAGGKTETFSNIYTGVSVSMRFLDRMTELKRLEQPAGTQTEQETIVIIYSQAYTIWVNDLMVDANGAKYLVEQVKGAPFYARTTQLRVRRMQ